MKEEYNKLKKSLKLPDFKKIDNEFELSDLEETSFLLRDIRRKMIDKVDFYAKILEPIIQPETNIVCMFECKAFDDDEKLEIYDMFRKMMSLVRSSAELSLECDDKKEAEFISELSEEWDKLKPKLMEKISKMRKSWQKKIDIKETQEYFG